MFENLETYGMIVSTAIFIITYIFIITEKIDRVIVALCGGTLMVITGVLTQNKAFEAIDFNTLGLLISMMVIVMITAKTGVFQYLSIKVVKAAKGEPWKILVYLSLITAFASAFLDNVTTILLVLPITISVCQELKIKPVPFVISQIFASNIGGTATLVGDPPNMMIATGASLNFIDFIFNTTPVIIFILPVTILAFLVLYRKHLHALPENKAKVLQLSENNALKDKNILMKSLSVLFCVIILFILHSQIGLSSSTVAISGAVVLMLISKVPTESILKEVEWKTIFFFAGLFMLVGGLDHAGVLKLIANSIVTFTGDNPLLLGILILWVSAIVSAFVDNIPFTATMIPLIKEVGALSGISLTPLWWALSLGACLGGNGTIIGASANVVASGMSEEAGYKITFGEYFKVCFPVMIITIIISTIYLAVFYLR